MSKKFKPVTVRLPESLWRRAKKHAIDRLDHRPDADRPDVDFHRARQHRKDDESRHDDERDEPLEEPDRPAATGVVVSLAHSLTLRALTKSR